MSDITEYRRLNQQVCELASRWVLAWDQYAYRGGCNPSSIYLHHDRDVISFTSQAEGGRGLATQMSLKYLDDDSTLEADAKQWYDDLIGARNRDMRRAQELRNQLAALPGARDLQEELSRVDAKNGWGNWAGYTSLDIRL